MSNRLHRLVTVFVFSALAWFAGLVIFAAFIGHYTPRLGTQNDAQTLGRAAIVVLTGGDRRVDEGLRLFGEGHARRLLVSGAHKTTTHEDMRRRLPLPAPLLDCCLDLGYVAQDTLGNAEETRDWVNTWGFTRLIVVTSNYHMPRSLIELARVLPGVELVPHPVLSRSYRSSVWWLDTNAVRILTGEYVKSFPAVGRYVLSRMWPLPSSDPGARQPVAPPTPAYEATARATFLLHR